MVIMEEKSTNELAGQLDLSSQNVEFAEVGENTLDTPQQTDSVFVDTTQQTDSALIDTPQDADFVTGDTPPKPDSPGEVSEMNRPPRKDVKIASLVILTLQNAALTICMRHARSRAPKELLFVSSTAVVLSEVVKLYTSLALVYMTETYSFTHFCGILYSTIIKQPMDTLKVCVPSVVYVIQNNLLYLASSHLDAATLQVTYQLKILTTAFFAVLILRRSLQKNQWLSLVILIIGIGLVQIADTKESGTTENQSRALGMVAALSACALSGFAGVYFEKILKGSEISVWMRNVQLSAAAIPIALATAFIGDWDNVTQKGFFFGYDYFVVIVVLLQAWGGLLVAVVIKYADNILKGFATSLAIILACILSIYFFDFHINVPFSLGAIFVIIAVFLYGMPVRSSKTPRAYAPAKTMEEA